jgi:hypothetical protein
MGPLRQDIRAQSRLLIEPPYLVLYEFHAPEDLIEIVAVVDDRLVLDHGASGAPVLDCQGRVVAVVSNLFTQTMQFLSKPIRISTAWGQANVASVPIQELRTLPWPSD